MDRKLKLNLISMLISFVFIVFAWIMSSNKDTSITITLWALAFLIGGRAKAVEGISDTIKNKSLNVEILMLLSALGAFAIQNYQEGAILILIFGVSGVLEEYSMAKSEKELKSLLNLAPQTAIVLRNNQEIEISASDLQLNETVVVKVGAVIPADGVISHGSTALNQAALTGEFVPVNKTVGDEVLSGSINEESTIYVTVKKNPSESMVQKIVKFVETAQGEKTPTQSWIENFEEKYVYLVLFMSIAMMIIPALLNIWDWQTSFYRGIVLLVVASPCALVASIFPTMLATMSNAARHGILIKGATHIETLSKVDTIVMDKTGTITKGTPQVIQIVLEDNIDEEYVKEILYAAEKQSTHPLAVAITNHLKDIVVNNLETIETTEVPGQGVSVEHDNHLWQIGRFYDQKECDLCREQQLITENGYTTVAIYRDSILIGFVSLMDTMRDQVDETIQYLNTNNIEIHMLSGDNQYTANAIAKLAGIDKAYGELYPEEKVSKVKELRETGKVVAMIGDGINDSPALATADVGIAMGGGTDVTLETADVVFMNDNLNNLQHLLNLSKKGQRIAMQNVVFSLAVISLLILANVLQIVQLPLAVVFHEGSTILVILNGLRMLGLRDVQ
ncbi:MAG TPA: cadmium-translocating P-type ATPase [Erysipelothrix sp.]|nr:cadmium-translocating P-type ATPase [Erysipelothrix sp.]